MDIPEGHPSGVGVRDFMQKVEHQIHHKLEEEILALNEIKFQLRKDSPDGGEEYTDSVLRHKQEALSRLAKSMRI